MKERKRIALVTYNTVGEGRYPLVNRGKHNVVYVLQGKDRWAVKEPWRYDAEAQKTRAKVSQDIVKKIDLTKMDKVYVYVGEKGGSEIVRQTSTVPSDRIVYVMCGHNSDENYRVIEHYRGWSFSKMDCECGGRTTLEDLLKRFL